jgi:hypothetical protein
LQAHKFDPTQVHLQPIQNLPLLSTALMAHMPLRWYVPFCVF